MGSAVELLTILVTGVLHKVPVVGYDFYDQRNLNRYGHLEVTGGRQVSEEEADEGSRQPP